MTDTDKTTNIRQVKGLAKYFEVDITIKLFGVVIYEFHFPPKLKTNCYDS